VHLQTPALFRRLLNWSFVLQVAVNRKWEKSENFDPLRVLDFTKNPGNRSASVIRSVEASVMGTEAEESLDRDDCEVKKLAHVSIAQNCQPVYL